MSDSHVITLRRETQVRPIVTFPADSPISRWVRGDVDRDRDAELVALLGGVWSDG